MIKLLLVIGLLFITSTCYAESYTGKAENIEVETSRLAKGVDVDTPMGVKFEIVIKDSKGNEIARMKDYIATGTMTADETLDAIRNEVDLKTMEIYSHAEGAKEAISRKSEVENYTKTINGFIPLTERPNPQTDR